MSKYEKGRKVIDGMKDAEIHNDIGKKGCLGQQHSGGGIDDMTCTFFERFSQTLWLHILGSLKKVLGKVSYFLSSAKKVRGVEK